jgi:hypothetical protein
MGQRSKLSLSKPARSSEANAILSRCNHYLFILPYVTDDATPLHKVYGAPLHKELELRDSIFPDAEERLWDKNDDGGFMFIPKTMPYICRILGEISKNQPLGQTYSTLWAYTWNNNAFVRLNKWGKLAFAAGFKGQRGERTFRDRLKLLASLGFAEIKPNGSNPMGFAFLPNPHDVIMRIHSTLTLAASSEERAKMPNLREETFNAFLARALELGCKDVKENVAEAQKKAAKAKEPDEKRKAPVRPRPLRKSGSRKR